MKKEKKRELKFGQRGQSNIPDREWSVHVCDFQLCSCGVRLGVAENFCSSLAPQGHHSNRQFQQKVQQRLSTWDGTAGWPIMCWSQSGGAGGSAMIGGDCSQTPS
jgi:hypothetical protein